jgi:hypothetical protein
MQNPQVHEADLAIERDLGHNLVLGLTYMGSFGRELPRGIDTNLSLSATDEFTFTVAMPGTGTNPCPPSCPISTSTTKIDAPPIPAQSGYVVQPHGGAAAPLKVGQTYTSKVFLWPADGTTSTRKNTAYSKILDVRSDVNSSYNALAVQLNRRFEHGFSLLTNYTWSHSLDDNPYQSTVVPTFTALDPTNLKLEHGNSVQNVPQRFVFAAVYEPQTRFHGIKDYVLGGWRIAPVVQIQNGLPYTPYVSGSPSNLTVPEGTDGCTTAGGCSVSPAYSGMNGAGSSAARLPWIERNTYKYPNTAVVDMRLGKNFHFEAPHLSRMRLELLGEVFNLMNHQNITDVNDNAYTLSGTTLTQQPGFGTYTNSNSNWAYSPRQMQIAARLHF